jgi:hypothetical protein
MDDWEGNAFVHIEPKVPTPDHTYDRDEIFYDPVAKAWPTKFPFIKPHTGWAEIKKVRWSQLSWSDSHLSDDMPESLANNWKQFRQELRDLPEIYGACWTPTITAGGTGYSVGDHLLVDATVLGYSNDQIGTLDDLSTPMGQRPGFDFEADPNDGEAWKPDATVDTASGSLDVNIIVTSIGQDGAITGVRTRNAFNARHMKEAKVINNVAYTIVKTGDSSTTGTGATFKLEKKVRIDPWKVRIPQSPKAKQPGIWGESDQFPGQTGRYGAVVNGMDASTTLGDNVPDGTDANNRDNPADGWLMEHTYHPSTGHMIPPEMDGHYFGTDLARLGLSTDGTPFDDGVADGLPAAPTDAKGKTRIAGTITARKQTS